MNAQIPEDSNELDDASRERFIEEFKNIRLKFQSLEDITDEENIVLLGDIKKCEITINELIALSAK